MKLIDEQIKKIIRLYMMNCGDNEKDTILEIKTLMAKSFISGGMFGILLTIILLVSKL